MDKFKKAIISFLNKLISNAEKNFNQFAFYYLFKLKNQSQQFKITIDTKCLVLSQYPGAETKGLGGLFAQYPKNFEVLCLTNGSSLLPEIEPVESSSIKKQQFSEVMTNARVKGFKVFDINSNTLKDNYQTIKKIDISEADYIFVPNVYDSNPDTIALLKHFKQILLDKEHKKNLKIVMFESDFALNSTDFYENISSIVESKRRMLKEFYPEDKNANMIDKVLGLNAFRSIQHNCDYAECFLTLSCEEFIKIPLI